MYACAILCSFVYVVFSFLRQTHIQGGPKITERHTGVSSPEENYTKISNIGQGILILEYIISDDVEF